MSRKTKTKNRNRRTMRAAREARSAHVDVVSTRYYRRRARWDGKCSCCGEWIRRGDPIAYRKAGPVLLHLEHAERDPNIRFYDTDSTLARGRAA